MRYLTDTHVLIWAQNNPARLPPAIAGVLGDPTNEVFYSVVSIWEISIKFGLGKLDLLGHTPEEFLDGVRQSGIAVCPLTAETVASSHRLPRRHGDPFDRLLFWQAIREGVVLLCGDSVAQQYVPDGLSVVH